MTVRSKHPRSFRGKLARLAVALCLVGAAQAAEEINRDFLPGAPKRDLSAPKLSIPTTPSEQWRSDVLKELNSALPVNPMLPPTQPNRNFTREQEEAIDRKRNWIFVAPGDTVTTPEQALRVRDELQSKDEPYRSVMEQFLDLDKGSTSRGDATNRSSSSLSNTNPLDAKSDSDRKDDPLNRNTLKDDLQLGSWGRREDPLSIRSLVNSSGREGRSGEGSGSNSVPAAGVDPASNGPTFSLSNSAILDRAQAIRDHREMEEEKRKRQDQFQQLLNGRSFPARPDVSTGGVKDPINLLTDSSVSALTAVNPRGPASTLPAAPRLPSATAQPVVGPSSPFSLPDSVGRGGNLPIATGGTGYTPPPAPKFTPRPPILEIPKRKL